MIDDFRHKGLRRLLIKALRVRGIRDEKVLAAMGRVPRHLFFDEALLSHAYEDKAFSIGKGQTISQPYTVAIQTHLLALKTHDKVLEIGTGSGYQAGVLMEMGARVFTIETHKSLYLKAKQLLNAMGYYPHAYHGDGGMGLSLHAPYDAILVTAAVPDMDNPHWIKQLKPNGRIVAPVGSAQQQTMVRITCRPKQKPLVESFGQFQFVPLTGPKGF